MKHATDSRLPIYARGRSGSLLPFSGRLGVAHVADRLFIGPSSFFVLTGLKLG